jgi:large subunit ribosomal protein L10
MTKEEKNQIIEQIAVEISNYKHFYLADTSELDAADTSALRRKCFQNDIKLLVVKNTLFKKALEKREGDYQQLFDVLKYSTSVMFSNTGNAPAKLIKEFRQDHDKPVLKGAYVEECVYVGENTLESLINIKSKEELVGDIIGMLQAPAKNVISSLLSAEGKLAGIVKTLSEKEG